MGLWPYGLGGHYRSEEIGGKGSGEGAEAGVFDEEDMVERSDEGKLEIRGVKWREREL